MDKSVVSIRLLFRYCSAVAEEGSGTGVTGAASLPDRIALGVLTRLVTRELVEDVLAETGRREQRKRLLPARVTVYFVLALALFYGDSYEEVMRKLAQGLSWLAVWKREWHVPTSSALAQARERLGSEPLRVLFERAARPCAQRSTAGAWLCGRRLMSVDGFELGSQQPISGAQHVLQGQRNLTLDACRTPQQKMWRIVAELMPPVAFAHGQGVGDRDRTGRRGERGLQHHGPVQVAASHS